MNTLQELEKWISDLKNCGKAVIVEGSKDRRALEQFGIGSIFMLNKKPIFQVIEEVASAHKDVVILTDLDKEGRKLYGTLSSALQSFGVRVDNRFRELLLKRTKLRQIEGLVKYFEKARNSWDFL